MIDPFLRAHKHASKLYSLASRTPLSIRDQVFRAQTLIERLLSTQTLRAGNELLVVGAGAAGASIAVIAARCGVKVTAVDTNPHAFALQRACTTRWVDPVQYDWPLAHASRGSWPANHPLHAVPFGFAADYASSIAHQWASRLNVERLSPNLVVEFQTRLEKLPKPSAVTSGKLDATTELAGHPAQTRQFDVVVLAVGMASERTDVPFHAPSVKGNPHFRGIPFWMKDRLRAFHLWSVVQSGAPHLGHGRRRRGSAGLHPPDDGQPLSDGIAAESLPGCLLDPGQAAS